ncbi:MAG TPA: hypothetical protein ENH82_12145 [bacterium]|nr:hypothetical protein [bacterium]
MKTPQFKQPFRRANLAHKECEKLLTYCGRWFKDTEDYYLLKDSLVKASKLLNKIRSETLTKTDENGNTD